jgi:Zn-dependent M16 (insulinase) family peptidase
MTWRQESCLLTCICRPWLDSAQPPALKETIVTTAEFPEEDESVGEILVGFFGPNCRDLIETSALNILLTYLCGSSVSVLENILVEKEELASSVTQWWEARPNSVIWLQPTGVATEKLEFVEKRLMELLKEVASKPLDMDYMLECTPKPRSRSMRPTSLPTTSLANGMARPSGNWKLSASMMS